MAFFLADADDIYWALVLLLNNAIKDHALAWMPKSKIQKPTYINVELRLLIFKTIFVHIRMNLKEALPILCNI